jgi:hypothetical protein
MPRPEWSAVIREDRELLAELARLNTAMTWTLAAVELANQLSGELYFWISFQWWEIGVISMRKREILNDMQELVPPGSGEPRDPEVLERLASLTGELINTYDNDGELNEHPFRAVEARTIHLYEEDARERLQGRMVLATGGEGFIGSELINAVANYSPRKIVSVDIADQRTDNPTERQFYRIDISDLDSLARIFEAERPEVVFHLAAERDPARAEEQIKETVHPISWAPRMYSASVRSMGWSAAFTPLRVKQRDTIRQTSTQVRRSSPSGNSPKLPPPGTLTTAPFASLML